MKYIAGKYISFDRKNTPQILDTMRKEMKCSLMNFQGKKTKITQLKWSNPLQEDNKRKTYLFKINCYFVSYVFKH